MRPEILFRLTLKTFFDLRAHVRITVERESHRAPKGRRRKLFSKSRS